MSSVVSKPVESPLSGVPPNLSCFFFVTKKRFHPTPLWRKKKKKKLKTRSSDNFRKKMELYVWMFLMDSEVYVCGSGWTEEQATSKALEYFRNLPSMCLAMEKDSKDTCTKEAPCEECACDLKMISTLAEKMSTYRRFMYEFKWFHLFAIPMNDDASVENFTTSHQQKF